jgi:hypothetical protein
MYDLDDNHLIDFGDLSFFAAAFGRTVGLPSTEPPYAWWADFDKSGLVDFGDLSFLAANFGKGRAGGQALGFPTNFPTAWARAPQAGPGEALQGGAAVPTPDVNGDGRVTPLDALILINALHERSARGQSNAVNTLDLQPPYLDPNLDGYLTAADVLTVINYVNGTGRSLAGEGEPPGGLNLAAHGNSPFFGGRGAAEENVWNAFLGDATHLSAMAGRAVNDGANDNRRCTPLTAALRRNNERNAAGWISDPILETPRDVLPGIHERSRTPAPAGEGEELDRVLGSLEDTLSDIAADVSIGWRVV